MSQNYQQALRNNRRLLRATFGLPQETFFQSLVRRLETFVKNGIALFKKICQPRSPINIQHEVMKDEKSQKETKKTSLKYNFNSFLQNQPALEPNQNDEKQKNFMNRDRLEEVAKQKKSKEIQDEEQFLNRIKKPSKRIKRQMSQSQEAPQLPLKPFTKKQRQFFQQANFSYFCLYQKCLAQTKRKAAQKGEASKGSSLYKQYLEYSKKSNNLFQNNNEQLTNRVQTLKEPVKRQHRLLRKKIQIQDQTPFYDINKVYESMDEAIQARRLQRQKAKQIKEMQIQENQRALAKSIAQAQRNVQDKKKQMFQQRKSQTKQYVESLFKNNKKQPVLQQQKNNQQQGDLRILGQNHKNQSQHAVENKTTTFKKGQESPQKKDKNKDNPFMTVSKRQLGLSDFINNYKSPQVPSVFNPTINPHVPTHNIFRNNQTPVFNIFSNSVQKEPTFLIKQTPGIPFSNFSDSLSSNTFGHNIQNPNDHTNKNLILNSVPNPMQGISSTGSSLLAPTNNEPKGNLFLLPPSVPAAPSLFSINNNISQPGSRPANPNRLKSKTVRIS